MWFYTHTQARARVVTNNNSLKMQKFVFREIKKNDFFKILLSKKVISLILSFVEDCNMKLCLIY